jgi:hypothetical protein
MITTCITHKSGMPILKINTSCCQIFSHASTSILRDIFAWMPERKNLRVPANHSVLSRLASSQIRLGLTSNQTVASNRKLAGDEIATVDSPLQCEKIRLKVTLEASLSWLLSKCPDYTLAFKFRFTVPCWLKLHSKQNSAWEVCWIQFPGNKSCMVSLYFSPSPVICYCHNW